jgi:hypothetical protein
MVPPEIVLDRWLKTQAHERQEFRGYIGKADIDGAQPDSFGSLLHLLQGSMNQALQSENANASGGTEHPPFHFDYAEVSDGTKNAHAFQHGGFSFIVVTIPLVQMLWTISQRLSRSVLVLGLLGIDQDAARLEAVQALLFQFQLAFLVSHEYTHHVHQHCSSVDGTWDEFVQAGTRGGLKDQALELDADGYALYLTLANYVRGAARQNALAQVGKQNLPGLQGDEFLLTAFFIALTALFCSMWPENVPISEIRDLRHPPAPVRIEYAIRDATMWCGQNASVSQAWFEAERFSAIYLAVINAITGGGRSQWDSHIAFLRSEDGAAYDRQLTQQFDAVRKGAERIVKSEAVI